MLKIIIPGEPVGWNELYAARHWIHRHRIAKAAHAATQDAIRYRIGPNGIARLNDVQMLTQRVDIRCQGFYTGKTDDPDNLCVKVYIDGLVGLLLKNDSRKYVRWVTMGDPQLDNENPRVEIVIREVER